EQILHKIAACKADAAEKERYLVNLEILSQLRNLQQLVIAKAKTMALEFDIKKDLRYLQGREEGKQEGWKEGKQEGWKEGKQEGWKEGKQIGKQEGAQEEKLNIARQALAEGLPTELIARITGLSKIEIEQLRSS
ncbi:MAG: hypothetical protein RML72_04970, partial [Bacteroidia bacterium]|nr:hypothetical protein [Bacteroidia bacterium]